MEMTRTKAIATEIMNQIKALDFWALGAYAAHQFIALEENKSQMGGLGFKVAGYNSSVKFVRIILKWNDTYTIQFLSEDVKVIKEQQEVYADQLIEVLDWIEERQ